MRILIALLICGWLTPAAATDDFKVIKLEQDMRNLEREVRDLQRQLADLQQRSRSGIGTRPTAAPEASSLSSNSGQWLNAANWKRVNVGMEELEVLSLLGPPTSLRGAADSPSRTLMYAMEIGSSGFLSGSVQLKDRVVVEVSPPVLR
ncbi:hypothetical protein [Povalibacter sp.]|uniref:hypothetical protein n=1 Tax=Povalibacter sp. TaxID=1962978 RepID=UPI002F408AD8